MDSMLFINLFLDLYAISNRFYSFGSPFYWLIGGKASSDSWLLPVSCDTEVRPDLAVGSGGTCVAPPPIHIWTGALTFLDMARIRSLACFKLYAGIEEICYITTTCNSINFF